MKKLDALIEHEMTQDVDPAITDLALRIKDSFEKPEGVLGIVLYGSGLWQKDVQDCVWDLYVLVDRFASKHKHPGLQIAGSIFPPNVYFIDTPLSCKYAVMRLDQFEHGASDKAFKPQIWARFSQPCRVIYARDDKAQQRIKDALCQAVLTFHKRTWNLINFGSSAKDVWIAGLNETYSSEMRSEKKARMHKIFKANPESYEQRTAFALEILEPQAPSTLFKFKRVFKRPLLKILYIIQLTKAVFTFQNGVDYALWKIKRHSDVDIQATDFQRRYPLIGAWPLLWKVYRAGGLR